MGDAPERAPTTVETILAASRQVIARRGSERFTMSAIAAAAGVSRPTLYRWFPSKEALLEAITEYEVTLFEARLRAAIAAQRSPAKRLDAALRCLVTYLDGLLGPDPIGADPEFAIRSLAELLEPQARSFAALLSDSLDLVPAVRAGSVTADQAAELFLRVAYSHYLVPHPDPELLVVALQSLIGVEPPLSSRRRAPGRPAR